MSHHLYPIITTPAPLDCRDFYVSALQARVLFQKEWYAHLSVEGWEIGFLRPNPPVRMPLFQHASVSRGLCLALEVQNVRELHAHFLRINVPRLAELAEYPGGEWAFSVMDPAGVVLNIVERQPDAATSFEL